MQTGPHTAMCLPSSAANRRRHSTVNCVVRNVEIRCCRHFTPVCRSTGLTTRSAVQTSKHVVDPVLCRLSQIEKAHHVTLYLSAVLHAAAPTILRCHAQRIEWRSVDHVLHALSVGRKNRNTYVILNSPQCSIQQSPYSRILYTDFKGDIKYIIGS